VKGFLLFIVLVLAGAVAVALGAVVAGVDGKTTEAFFVFLAGFVVAVLAYLKHGSRRRR